METFQSYIEGIIAQLITLNGLEDKAFEIHNVLKILTAECLAHPMGLFPPKRLSRICSDGTPIEFSVTLSKEPSALRYVTEITSADLSINDRLRMSRQRITAVLNAIGEKTPNSFASIFEVFFPDVQHIYQHLNFGVWYGVAHYQNATLIKLYFNVRWRSTQEAWKCIKLLFDNIHQGVPCSIDSNSWLRRRSRPVAVALEIHRESIKAIKIYCRAANLSTLDIKQFFESLDLVKALDSFVEFDKSLLEGPRKYVDSVILSVRFPTKKSDNISAKFEVAAAKYMPSDEIVRDRLLKIISIFGYDTSVYEGTLQILSNGKLSSNSVRSHTVIGIGLNKIGPSPLNVYIKPSFW